MNHNVLRVQCSCGNHVSVALPTKQPIDFSFLKVFFRRVGVALKWVAIGSVVIVVSALSYEAYRLEQLDRVRLAAIRMENEASSRPVVHKNPWDMTDEEYERTRPIR